MDGGWVVPGQRRESPLAGPLRQIRSALACLRAASGVLSDDDCRDGVREVASVLAEVEAGWLGLVADLDTRPDAVPGAAAGHVARAFLTGGLNRTVAQARRDEAAATVLGDLPQVAAAFAAGGVSREHVDACAAVVAKLPADVRGKVDDAGHSVTARVDAYLAEQSRIYDARAVANLGTHVIAALAPDAGDGFDPKAYRKRYLRFSDTPGGMMLGRFALDQAGAAHVKAALAHLGKPTQQVEQPAGQPVGQQEALPIRDERSQGQRHADALVQLARLAMAADESTTHREPPHVLVITTPDQLAAAHTRGGSQHQVPPSFRASGHPGLAEAGHGVPISRGALAVLSCDAIVQAIVLDPDSGAVLNLGRTQRTASRAQRRALTARDRGCIICGAPAHRCDAHHVRYWSLGGGTDIANQALLCQHCHILVHHGIWTITMRDGVPWVRPPAWHHLARPDGAPIRNHTRDAAQRAHRLGQQLRLDLGIDPPLEPPPDTG